MSFKQIKPTTMEEITENVFMVLSDFDPATFNPAVGIDASKIVGTTTGGITFTDTPEYVDYGEDLDNCPKNTMELKRKKSSETKVSGTFATVTADGIKMLIGAATKTGNKVIPDVDLSTIHFIDKLWLFTDYGNGGYLAIKLKRVLNTSGLSISTTDGEKTQYAFEFTSHTTIEDISDPPYEVWVYNGNTSGGVELNTHSVEMEVDDTYTLTATTVPANQTVTWSSSSSSVASVAGGLVTALTAGSTIITASVTVDGVAYTDTCTVVVSA